MPSLLSRIGGMLLLAAVIPAKAQFAELAATDDGKQVYFTSQLLLKGASQTGPVPESRLYRVAADGVTVFAERGSRAPEGGFTSSDGVSAPQVSGDGSVVGFTFYDVCPASGACTEPINSEGVLRGKTSQDIGPGVLQLSRNGRWALLTQTDFSPRTPTQTSVLIDLSTGQRTSVPPSGIYTGLYAYHNIASDGTVLGQQNETTGLWKNGTFTPIQFPVGLSLSPIAISDDAGTLFLNGAVPSPSGLSGFRLLAMNLASGKLTTIVQPTDSTVLPVFMGASNNGNFVLYRNGAGNGPAFVFSMATGVSMPIALPTGEYATDGTLTGGGDVAFLATTAGRLVKFTLTTGAVDSLFPVTPHCADPSIVVPGSLVRLRCNFSGSVSDLQGKLLVDDVPMAILSVANGEIAAQIPWGVGGFLGATLTLQGPNNSPFQAAQALNTANMIPRFELADEGTSSLLGLKFIKSDWSGLLTTQPAPGDIFYAYMTGLGAVDGPMQTGVPAPATPAPILGSLVCRFNTQSSPAKTLFAGLAPGTIGIYQVAFQLPSDAGAKPIGCLSCSWSGGFFFQGGLTGACAN